MTDPKPDETPAEPSMAAPPSNAAAHSAVMHPGGQGKAIAIGIIVLILIILGVWFGRSALGGGGAEKAATAFFQSNADEGAAIAYDRTAATFHDVTPEAAWANTSRQYNLGSFTSANWTQRDAEGDLTTVRGKLHLAGNADLSVVVDLRRIDGNWKVATVAFQAPDQSQPQAALSNGAPTSPVPAGADATGAQQPNGSTLPTPGPVMSVPEFGGAPNQTAGSTVPAPGANAAQPNQLQLGRAGPAGSAVASGQVGPACMGTLWSRGIRTTEVDCPTYLPTHPGATEQCVGRLQAGGTTNITVTFQDYDPATRQSTFDCEPS